MDCASGEETEGAGRGNWVVSEGRERLYFVELVHSKHSNTLEAHRRTFKETECGSFSASAATEEVVR